MRQLETKREREERKRSTILRTTIRSYDPIPLFPSPSKKVTFNREPRRRLTLPLQIPSRQAANPPVSSGSLTGGEGRGSKWRKSDARARGSRLNARVKSREGFSRCNNISIQFEARPFTPPPSLPPPSVRYPEQHPPSIYAPPCSGWRSSHSTARPLTIVSHPCIPTPKRAGGWHVAHYVICPLDQSTGGAHFFPAWAKKKREKNAARRRSVVGARRGEKVGGGRGCGAEDEESGAARKSERGYRYTVARWRRPCAVGREGEEGGVEKERAVRHYPRSPVADQSPYVKRHFLWVPLGRPVCVIKIDLSPLLFFFAAPSTLLRLPRPPSAPPPNDEDDVTPGTRRTDRDARWPRSERWKSRVAGTGMSERE